jgi:hypothetical protein
MLISSFTDKYTYPWLCKTFIMFCIICYLSLWPEFETWYANSHMLVQMLRVKVKNKYQSVTLTNILWILDKLKIDIKRLECY